MCWVPFGWPSPSERRGLFRLRGASCRGVTRVSIDVGARRSGQQYVFSEQVVLRASEQLHLPGLDLVDGALPATVHTSSRSACAPASSTDLFSVQGPQRRPQRVQPMPRISGGQGRHIRYPAAGRGVGKPIVRHKLQRSPLLRNRELLLARRQPPVGAQQLGGGRVVSGHRGYPQTAAWACDSHPSDREPNCLHHDVVDRLRRAGQVAVGVNADDHPAQVPQRRRRR